MKMKADVLKQLESLIKVGQPIAESYKFIAMAGTRVSTVPEWEIRQFVTGASATIDRIVGRDSQFYRQIVLQPVKPLSHYAETVMSIVGSLKALHDAVKDDHLLTVQQLAEAGVLDDFLLQSRSLIDANYHVAAMVLIGGVIEEHLSKLCASRGLALPDKPGLSAYNDVLRGTVLDQPTWRRPQAIADLRNLAAHGKGGDVKIADVDDAWKFASRLLTDYPK